MLRLSVFTSILAICLLGLLVGGRSALRAGAQDAPRPTTGHSLIGSWVVEEILRPQNATPDSPPPNLEPQAVAIASFYADGNALITGYLGDPLSRQGMWSADGEHTAAFTVVSVTFDRDGFTSVGLDRVSATVELDVTGERFAAAYTFEAIDPNGRVSFRRFGSWTGTRLEVQPPERSSLPWSTTVVPASGTPTAKAPPASWIAVDRTALRYFVPLGPNGLKPTLTATATETGSCFTGSVRNAGRPDAWRCSAGNAILDPCFQGPLTLPDQPGELACADSDSPFDGEVVLLKTTAPLPMEGANEADPTQLPWVLELVNGERCTLFSGTLQGIAGQVAHYGCASGGLVVGEPDRTQRLWVVSYLPADAARTDFVTVAVAWF
jgi:hypothetical protein